ncbi:Cyclin-A1-3 [Ranunculus cassubicifolius]
MSTQPRRSSISSSTSSKRPAAMENATKVPPIPLHQAKKRVALGNVTNQINNNSSRVSVRNKGGLGNQSSVKAPAPTSAKVNKGLSACTTKVSLRRNSTPASSAVPTASALRSSTTVSRKDVSIPKLDRYVPNVASHHASCDMDISPSRSPRGSVSMDETMSTCDSLNSPDVEYIDNADASEIALIARKTSNNFHISEYKEAASGNICKRDLHLGVEISDKIFDIDNNHNDPQLCATIACDIYNHLRASENKKRASTDFMDSVQKDINPSMRAILIDWLVEVAEEYRLVPDTLYLTVNYIDRYLSGNVMNRQRLQLLGVACMMIASKYEEICAPQVEEFCYITDNTYFKEEVLEMESAVLNYLKFEMTAPTAKCFIRRFVHAALGSNEVPSLQLECLGNYVAELSLLEYNMLWYSPSLIAASAIFLAKFILQPAKRPWHSTLVHYTLYKPSELRECVNALHQLFCGSNNSGLPAIREKYSQHKYKFVAKKYCPPSIPSEYFSDH